MLGVSVVLFHSPAPAVTATLAGLARQSAPPDFVVVHVNEATGEETSSVREMVAALAPAFPVEIAESAENRGFCRPHNDALSAGFRAGATAMVVLNPDLVLDPHALEQLVAASDGHQLLGPVLELSDPDTLQPTGLVDTMGIRWTASGRHLDAGQGSPIEARPSTAPWVVAGVSGACLFVPRAVHADVVAVGGEFFDADLFAYREDAELGFRAAMLGIASVIVPAARGLHVRRLRGTTRGGDRLIDRLGVRNRFLIAFKYGSRRPGSLPRSLARDLVVCLAALTVERSSRAGLIEAWRLRARMRAKGELVIAAAARYG
jgi:GT2 family glycosyltransferase